jgi:hypothetical protein
MNGKKAKMKNGKKKNGKLPSEQLIIFLLNLTVLLIFMWIISPFGEELRKLRLNGLLGVLNL